MVVIWLVAAAVCSAAEPGTLLEDHFRDRVSAEWSAVGYGLPAKFDPAQAALGKDPAGRDYLEIRSGASISKNCSQWKDYRLTFSFRLPQPTADGAQLLRVIVRGPAANIWGGYNVYLFNAGGKFKIQANVWPTNPTVTTPVTVDSQWHRLSVSVLGQELKAELDDRGDARVATTDVYDASTVGGIYLGFSPGKWQLADVRVVALRPILEAADVLARYCLFAYHPSLDKLAIKADLGECSDQPWARSVTAIRFAVQPAGKSAVLAQGEIALDAKKFGTADVQLPKLPEGQYELKLAAVGTSLTAAKQFVRRFFPWEKNSLGVTREVYPPFEPISVQGRDVKVVGRVYRMNDLGLWDRVQSQGHDLLAGPITLRCETFRGPGGMEIGQRPFPAGCRRCRGVRGRGRVAGRRRADHLDRRVRRLHEGRDGPCAAGRRPGRPAAMAGDSAGGPRSAALLPAAQRLPRELRGADAAGRKDRLAATDHGVDELSRKDLEGRARTGRRRNLDAADLLPARFCLLRLAGRRRAGPGLVRRERSGLRRRSAG